MHQHMNCTGCYKKMLPRVLSETPATLLRSRQVQHFCSLCGHEQPETGGEIRPWFKKTLIVISLFVLVTTFLYAI